jgi:hypothetical protein
VGNSSSNFTGQADADKLAGIDTTKDYVNRNFNMYVDTRKVTLAALIRWMIAIAIAQEHVGVCGACESKAEIKETESTLL